MKLTFLSTSDLHGYVFPTDFRKRNQSLPFGATKVKELMTKIAAETTEPVFKIDNGDFLQGSPLSYFAAKKPASTEMAAVMNAMGYDAGVLGNHEFNYGREYLERTLAALNYPVLCANILKEDGTPLTGHAYTIIEKAGVKVAILGLTTQYIPNWEQPATVKGLTFKSAVTVAQEYLPQLRALADIVVVSYHGGFERDLTTGSPTEVLTGENEGYELLNNVPGIDVLLTGHQHREIVWNQGDVPTTQPGDKGRFLAQVTLSYDQPTKEIRAAHSELLAMTGEENHRMREKFTPLLTEVEGWLDTRIGRVEGNMAITDPMAVRTKGHPYIEFIHQVQMEATGAKISGTALFDNNGKGFSEEITMRDIVTNYIYPNTLAVVKVTGAEFKAALERSASYFEVSSEGELIVSPAFLTPKVEHYNYDLYTGVNYQINVKEPVGQRISGLTYEGQLIQPTDELELVINQYRAVGGGDYPMFGPEKIIREVTVDMTELMSDYLQKHPVITTKETTNFSVNY
ncbi:bifunctional metallophosphatase/5'-nucleotidase [Vagococcus salmoninarum]|uniref:bifunctional metallophosphatase/5'-nucleotidase n=1 Tax=Vagococcus salmoninarum TaxID=2739 RepID=UPI003F9BFBE9